MTVYLAGFARTQAAAQRLEAGSDARRRPADARAPLTADAAAQSVVNSRHDENGVMVASSPTTMTGQPATSTPAATTPASPTVAAASAPSGGSMGAATSAGASSAATTSSPATTATATVATAAAAAVTTTAVPQTSAPVAVASAPAPAAPVAPTTVPTAPVATPAAPAADSAKSVGWKDGTYSGWGTSRHGDIEATVVIENGKITGAIISRCLTRYSCSWVAHLQAQVVTRQSPEVDNVSGATQSANAFYYAVVDALSKAK